MKLRLRGVTLDDIGLIRKAAWTFEDGLAIFTGETGSGKTMVLGGIAFGLGDRTRTELVRSEAETARVELVFECDEAARLQFERAGFPLDPGESAIVEREMHANGKSQARINGRSATASQIREFFAGAIERVGQHDQQHLLDPRAHLDVIDRFGGAQLLRLRGRVEASHARLGELERERTTLAAVRERSFAEREDAEIALAEIDGLAIGPDEDVVVRERRDRLQHGEKIARVLRHAQDALLEDDDAAIPQVGRAIAALREIERFGSHYGESIARLAAVEAELAETVHELAHELNTEDLHVNELEALDVRLAQIERCKRRYGGSLAGVAEARARFAAILLSESDNARVTAEAAERCRVAAQELSEDAERLSRARKHTAKTLVKRVRTELADLAMANAVFEVVFTSLERIGPSGAERVEFMLAPNAAASLRSIVKVASGGELSRILLALTVVLAEHNESSIMVFDEIDAGIGGSTAVAVGQRLAKLARHTQVICVTHLAQIAAYGDAHYVVRKSGNAGLRIDVRRLATQPDVVTEIARMLAGDDSQIAREHALDLLERRQSFAASGL